MTVNVKLAKDPAPPALLLSNGSNPTTAQWNNLIDILNGASTDKIEGAGLTNVVSSSIVTTDPLFARGSDFIMSVSGGTYYLYDVFAQTQTSNASYTTLMNSITNGGRIFHLRGTYIPDDHTTITLQPGTMLSGGDWNNTIIDASGWTQDAVLFTANCSLQTGFYYGISANNLRFKLPRTGSIGTFFSLVSCGFSEHLHCYFDGGNVGILTNGSNTGIQTYSSPKIQHCVFAGQLTGIMFGNSATTAGTSESRTSDNYFYNGGRASGTGIGIQHSYGTRHWLERNKFEKIDKGIKLIEVDSTHKPDTTYIYDNVFETMNTACIDLNGTSSYIVSLGSNRVNVSTMPILLTINNTNATVDGLKTLRYPLLVSTSAITQTVSSGSIGTRLNSAGADMSMSFDTTRYVPIKAVLKARGIGSYVGGTTVSINLVDVTNGNTKVGSSWNLSGSSVGGTSPNIYLAGASGLALNNKNTTSNQKLNIYFGDSTTTSINLNLFDLEIDVMDMANQ